MTFLSGCLGNTPDPIEISSKPINKPVLSLPQSDELNLRPVEWKIITPDNIDEVLQEIEASGRPVVLFALTDNGYENISLNLSDLRTYIQQQKSIIAAYDNYYNNAEQALDNAVTLN